MKMIVTLWFPTVIIWNILFQTLVRTEDPSQVSFAPPVGSIITHVMNITIPVAYWQHILQMNIPCIDHETLNERLVGLEKMISHTYTVITQTQNLTQPQNTTANKLYADLSQINLNTLMKLQSLQGTARNRIQKIATESQHLWGYIDVTPCGTTYSTNNRVKRQMDLQTLPVTGDKPASTLNFNGNIRHFYHQSPVTQMGLQPEDVRDVLQLDLESLDTNVVTSKPPVKKEKPKVPSHTTVTPSPMMNQQGVLNAKDVEYFDQPHYDQCSSPSRIPLEKQREAMVTLKLLLRAAQDNIDESTDLPYTVSDATKRNGSICIRQDVMTTCMDAQALVKMDKTCRGKRFRRFVLLPFMGDIQKVLMGTATVKDIEKLNKKLKSLTEVTNKNFKQTAASVEKMISYASQIDARVSRAVNISDHLSLRIDALANTTANVLLIVESGIKNLNEATRLSQLYDIVSSNIDLAMSTLLTMLQYLEEIHRYHEQVYSMIRMGVIDKSVVGAESVRKVVTLINANLPSDLDVAPAWQSQFNPEWTVNLVTSGVGAIHLHLSFPLVKRNSQIKVWRFSSVPIRNGLMCFHVRVGHQLFLVDHTTSQWAPMPADLWQLCDPLHKQMCDFPMTWFQMSTHACFPALFLNDGDRIETDCRLKYFSCNDTQRTHAVAVSATQWLISTFDNTMQVKKTCGVQGETRGMIMRTIRSSAVIQVDEGCIVTAGKMTFQATKHYGEYDEMTKVELPKIILPPSSKDNDKDIIDLSMMTSDIRDITEDHNVLAEAIERMMAVDKFGSTTLRALIQSANAAVEKPPGMRPNYTYSSPPETEPYGPDSLPWWVYILASGSGLLVVILMGCVCMRVLSPASSLLVGGMPQAIPMRTTVMVILLLTPCLARPTDNSTTNEPLTTPMPIVTIDANGTDPIAKILTLTDQIIDHALSHSSNLTSWVTVTIMVIVSLFCHYLYRSHTSQLLSRVVIRLGVYPKNTMAFHGASECPVTLIFLCDVHDWSDNVVGTFDLGTQVGTIVGTAQDWKIKHPVNPDTAITGPGLGRTERTFIASLTWPSMCITNLEDDIETCAHMPKTLKLHSEDVVSQYPSGLPWNWCRIVPNRLQLVRIGDVHQSSVLYEASSL
jgi:hypothetical protein